MGLQLPASTTQIILDSAGTTISNNIVLFGTILGVIGAVTIIGILFSFFHK